jgi:GntR family transcriptional regulator / MocR family aminotransferase
MFRLEGKAPAYRRIYQQIREAGLAGQLPPGNRLPATRRLAQELGVTGTTVVQAYEQLCADGYLECCRGPDHGAPPVSN